MMTKLKKLIPILFILLILLSTALIVIQYNRDQGLDDTSATTSTSKLELKNQSDVNPFEINTEISVNLSAKVIDSSEEVRIADVILNFNRDILEVADVIAGSEILLVETDVNNDIGIVSANFTHQLPGSFPVNSTLLTFVFRLKDQSIPVTQVTIDSDSTFGFPNTLNLQSLPILNIVTVPSYCGDGVVQNPNFYDNVEVCDDGDNKDGDQCSRDCSSKCPNGFIWDGIRCIDYNIDNGTPTPTVTTTPTATPIVTSTVLPTTIRPTTTNQLTTTPTQTTPTPTTTSQVTPTTTVTVTNEPSSGNQNQTPQNRIIFYLIIVFSFVAGGLAIYSVVKS